MDSENVEEDLRRLEQLAKDTAVGDTMYDKKSVIEKILEVGKHFQETSYIRDGEVRELEPDIEEKLCTLWDISVEEDVLVLKSEGEKETIIAVPVQKIQQLIDALEVLKVFFV